MRLWNVTGNCSIPLSAGVLYTPKEGTKDTPAHCQGTSYISEWSQTHTQQPLEVIFNSGVNLIKET